MSSSSVSLPPGLVESARHKTPDALLDAFHLAASRSNLNDYFGCFHAQGTFLGTDAQEHWSVADFYQYAYEPFQARQGWTYKPIHRSLQYFCSSTICTFDELLDAGTRFSTARGSGCLLLQQGYWFVASYHLSFPIPNDLAQDLTQQIRRHELKQTNPQQLEAEAERAAAELLAQIELEQTNKSVNDSKNNKRGSPKKGKKKK